MLGKLQFIGILLALFCIQACDKNPWNDPYPDSNSKANTLYSSFSERPKHLDPAISYNANEWLFINQIYEPPLQYHYLKRPYELVPLLATKMPSVRYFDKNGKELPKETAPEDVSMSVYQINIKPGVKYQEHPAFAKNALTGQYLYHELTPKDAKNKYVLQDFAKEGSRELIAEDFVYQIKRLADPTLNSPILGLMENYIVGMKDLVQQLKLAYQKLGVTENQIKFLDLRKFSFEGAKVLDRYTYEIRVHGKYPQFQYWLAMPFFAPIPFEVAAFYAQTVLLEKNISLDWYPVGTGPFYLKKNNPNLEMILQKNPNFHGERYPFEGMPNDVQNGLLKNSGKSLPFLDEIVFILEKEDVPYWSKFLQGYYDQSGVSTNNFDQALKSIGTGNLELTQELVEKGIKLNATVQPTDFYWGFNMLDETVGGYSVEKKKLRQAISIAVDMEEYINIFLNGNGIVAMSPLPPSIFGFSNGMQGANPVVYTQNKHSYTRKSLNAAKKLLKEAGYPEGIDPKTNQPLVLFFDAIISGGSETQAQFSWLRKQFKKLGIEMIVRATQYNRFQDKIRNGDVQIYWWGWNADYPDPENFLFLLYGPNGKVKFGGENASNYANANFDSLFAQMKSMDNTPQRAAILKKMISIIQEDAPWIWGFHPKIFTLRQGWVAPFKPNAMSRNTLKYISIDPTSRALRRSEWNPPIIWPLVLGILALIFLCIPAAIGYWSKKHRALVLKPIKPFKE